MNRRHFLAAMLATPLAPGLATGKDAPTRHLIWRKPPSASLVLKHGPTGVNRRPVPPFRFVEEDLGGSSPKIKIVDARKTSWIAKWAAEIHSETFASRIAASAGYFVRTAYFVPRGQIIGCKGLGRAKDSIDSDGRFESAVFKLIAEDEPYMKGHNWGWEDNPFLASRDSLRELNGLKTTLMLMSNWDAKDSRDVDAGPNTAIYEVKRRSLIEYRYAFDDWGGSMGRWGDFFHRSKWDPSGFAEQTKGFIRGLDDDGFIRWGYSGTNSSDVTRGITPQDVAWLLKQLGPLRDADLKAGLVDSGASKEATAIFARALRDRLDQLQRIAGQA